MRHYPYLSLSQIEVDVDLVRRLPRKLAYYYLALPLSLDGAELSVALADPDNPFAISMLERVFNTRVIPVHSGGSEIREALNYVWKSIKKPPPHILTWGSTDTLADFASGVGELLRTVYGAQVTNMRPEDLQTLTVFTQQDTYSLTIAGISEHDDIANFVREAATPILVLRDGTVPKKLFGNILLALRGHAPDLSTVNWLIPLVQFYRSELTILAVTASQLNSHGVRTGHSLAALLDPDQEQAQHLMDCTDRLSEVGITGYLKLCQGEPIEQVSVEFGTGHYSLLVVISEANGDFILRVLNAVNAQAGNLGILIVKPTLTD
jgi:hypothetical protein